LIGPAVLLLWLAAALGLMLGIRPRLGAGILAALSALLLPDSRIYNQHLYLLGLVCLLVAVADRSASPRATVGAWSLTLLKLQASVVYGYGALAKLSIDFVSGRVLFSASSERFFTLLGPLRGEPIALVPISIAVIAVELFLAVAPWVPRLRGLVLAIAAPFHLGMILFLSGNLAGVLALSVFGAIQLTILLVVFAPRDRLVVVWDDQCSFCSRWVRAFTRLDHLRLLDLRPLSQAGDYAATGIRQEAARDALQLRAADGSIHGGFEAVRRIAYALPLTMLLAPWLSLWPVRAIGGRAYRRVAIRRQCAVGSATA